MATLSHQVHATSSFIEPMAPFSTLAIFTRATLSISSFPAPKPSCVEHPLSPSPAPLLTVTKIANLPNTRPFSKTASTFQPCLSVLISPTRNTKTKNLSHRTTHTSLSNAFYTTSSFTQ
ncbi:hypothetical protein BC827DRAFT_1193136, partial [Russula dissimulans]